ncbi:MAG: SUMF1/EgtB/PvdO family nonheme iron enzyme [Candidatus Accumulibacter sp.]|uniref:SUMF1/EgtB/PvdO family nonheme iron enzyme n=1 Tax=Accumulibacter sp. TaxID=2053492 RepID=UPI001A4808A6|nr:SUMF1/EgtB/PvdO family nonheme iron enzyme [Planctomycetia bacterium]MCM8621104.1 SUMF1/EgtB/PvdO family nonheme iron enzyme [Accumulibacter sp.]
MTRRQARKTGRRVLRGGSFDNPPANLRSANRDDDDPENRNRNNGFRCVRVPPQHAAPCAMQRLSGPSGPHPGPSVPVASRTSGRTTFNGISRCGR